LENEGLVVCITGFENKGKIVKLVFECFSIVFPSPSASGTVTTKEHFNQKQKIPMMLLVYVEATIF
jgi:hypothetical protein